MNGAQDDLDQLPILQMEKQSLRYVTLRDAQLARHRAGSKPMVLLPLGRWAEDGPIPAHGGQLLSC